MQDSGRVKSNIRIYWYVWSILVTLLLAARFTIFRDSSEGILSTLLGIYIAPTLLAVLILNHFEGQPLKSYLKQNHRSKWEEWFGAKSKFAFGEEFLNSNDLLAFIVFLYSRDDLGDRVIGELKRNYRRFISFGLTVFFTFIPMVIFLH